MSETAGAVRASYDLAFQVSPIILQNGIAAAVTGGMLPIVMLTGQLASFIQGFASTSSASTLLDSFYCRFLPIPGATVINNTVGQYPFANQQVAANAIIEQPNTISLQMIAPVKDTGGYLTKLAIFTSLRTSLQQHNISGGTYAIATPSYIYTNCVMTTMVDVTPGGSKQQQIMWQLDFVQPLITQQQAQAAQASMTQALTNGTQITGTPSWSSAATSTGTTGASASSIGSSGLLGSVNQFLASPVTSL